MGKKFCKIGSKWCKYLRRGVCDFSHTSTESLVKCPRISQIETIQFADLLKSVEFETVFSRLLFYFPSQERSKQKYKEVFETLLNLKPRPMTNLKNIFIKVSYQKDFFDNKEYITVSGTQVFDSDNVNYGIEFCSWKDWVSMHITQDSLDNFSKEDIVAACLYEMTFFGFTDSEVQAEAKKLQESYEECKKLITIKNK